MRIFLFLVVLGFYLSGCGTEKSSNEELQWYKGNLHTHSYWSDGDEFPEVIMDWYKSGGYHFVALTDHNTLAKGEKWITIRSDSIYQKAFYAYLSKYGEEWVEYKNDSLGRIQVKLKTIEEYRKPFEKEGEFLIIQSEEITDHFDKKPLHLNATNVRNFIEPQHGGSVVEVLQNNIDAVLRQRDSLGIPMIVHINHPNFGFAISLQDMIAISNERFFEVYNGHHLVHNSGDSTHMSTEAMWDAINIAYTYDKKPLMYGLATDDAHNYHVKGRKWSNAGRGWIMVHLDRLDPESIIEALEAGAFYATTGVTLKELKLENNVLSVSVEEEEGVSYEISFIGCKKNQNQTAVIDLVKGPQAAIKISEDIMFVRCKITSSKLHENPVEDLIYETAWTQPVQYR